MGSTIKLTASQSTEEVNFLDVEKRKNINIYVFKANRFQQTSNHPKHMIHNIPKSQLLRLRRICSETSDFMAQCRTYMKYFLNRGYDEKKLLRTAKKNQPDIGRYWILLRTKQELATN